MYYAKMPFLPCLFVSISLVDNGGTESQGCVTTVSWHSVWAGVIVVGLQCSRGTCRICSPRAGNTAWAAVGKHIPQRNTFSEGNSLLTYYTSPDECNMHRTTFTLEAVMRALFVAGTHSLFGSNPSVELSIYTAVACLTLKKK